METRDAWVNRFQEAFHAIEKRLSEVLGAAGCREGWLQGELYRFFRKTDDGFRVNEYRLSGRQKADLYGSRPTEMIAEIKIYGTSSYLRKNIDGTSDISAFLPNTEGKRIDVRRADLDRVNLKEGSLLKDLLRLRSVEAQLQKYMILVIHKNGHKDKFGRAITAIRLTKEEWTFEFKDFILRIWRV